MHIVKGKGQIYQDNNGFFLLSKQNYIVLTLFMVVNKDYIIITLMYICQLHSSKDMIPVSNDCL